MQFSIIGIPVYPRYKYDNSQNLDMNLSRRRRYGSAFVCRALLEFALFVCMYILV